MKLFKNTRILVTVFTIFVIIILYIIWSFLSNPYKESYRYSLPSDYQLVDTVEGGNTWCMDACPWLNRVYVVYKTKQATKQELFDYTLKNGYTFVKEYEQFGYNAEGETMSEVLQFESDKIREMKISLADSLFEIPEDKRKDIKENAVVVIVYQMNNYKD